MHAVQESELEAAKATHELALQHQKGQSVTEAKQVQARHELDFARLQQRVRPLVLAAIVSSREVHDPAGFLCTCTAVSSLALMLTLLLKQVFAHNAADSVHITATL